MKPDLAAEAFQRDLSLGFSHLDASRPASAAGAFRRAVLSAPVEMMALYGAGFAALRGGDRQTAVRLLSWAWMAARRGTAPRLQAETLLALGHCLRSEGQEDRARSCLRRAVLLDPANAQAHTNLAGVLVGAEHLRALRRALTATPGASDYWNRLGLARLDAKSADAAEAAYRRALVLQPGHRHAWSNLGILHKLADELRLTIRRFGQARMIDPGNREAVLNLGRNLLLTGAMAEGWARLEEPWRAAGLQPRDGAFTLPVWDGLPLNGGRLLLWSEEKIGEEIMFSTLLDDVARRAGPVTLLCDPRIAGLLGPALPGIAVKGWASGTPPPVRIDDFAACYPLEFVGRFVRDSISDFPSPKPLLRCPPIARSGRARPRVGLHWRSVNPFVGDWKSVPLADWGPVLSVPGVDFVSLQYGDVADEVAAAQQALGAAPAIPEGIDQISDMAGFTEFVAGLDLVICVSSTTAHVAGSLGIETWILLPKGPGLSWFWFEDRADSPWYPNCRLYRQAEVGQWRAVLQRVGRDLGAWRVEGS
jgi:Flp pilus assembly protein TadD